LPTAATKASPSCCSTTAPKQDHGHGHGKILGGGMVGTHAGDMIGEIALAIEMGADAVDIGKTIHPHPTLGESIGMAAEVAHGSCTDVPPARK
jgi:dihydrolipoamide dehydrogenase